jgi:transcriptional regulator with XRE-family HTH domain
MDNKRIVERIRAAVKESGFTQREFAKKIGISETAISRWHGGDRQPSITSLKKIANATGKPLNFFLDSSIGSNNTMGSNAVIEINDVQTGAISSKINTRMELLEKDNELLKKDIEILKLQMELLKKNKKK